MKRGFRLWVAIGVAIVAGFSCAQISIRSIRLHEELGPLFGRGSLLALVHGHGIHGADVDRRFAELQYAAATAEETAGEPSAALDEMVANVAAAVRASKETVSGAEVKHELGLLRSQFPDERTWSAGLARSRLSMFSVAQTLKSNLRVHQWISQRLAPEVEVSEDECHQFYGSHLQSFFLPLRFRASHIFLAAPPETPPDAVEVKKIAIEEISVRLTSGEDFASLAAQNSEDEATKLRGGDLGYFSATRMPVDFVDAVTKLRPGEATKPIRTRLGFHIVKLGEIQPARQQSFDEVRGDIAIDLGNRKRSAALQKLIADLGKDANYFRPL
ncbi:MAG: peptidylprolyl isomerase [Verrucomicrobia bacterium]|nr:peptidylprolyl isomerase [Verrucomicrobiota bacterium]